MPSHFPSRFGDSSIEMGVILIPLVSAIGVVSTVDCTLCNELLPQKMSVFRQVKCLCQRTQRRNKHFLEQVGVHSIVDVVGYLYIDESVMKYYIPYLELNDPSNCQTFFLACMSFIIGRVNLYYFLLFPRCDSLCFLKAAVVVDTKI